MDEIDHLLVFIEQSNCTFIRNGDIHSSKDAREHIESKYQYIKKRVSTAEQFIKYAATKSSLSRKPYSVICGTDRISSSEWLTGELEKFRNAKEGKSDDAAH
jgi:Family of unknown function (DUF5329)